VAILVSAAIIYYFPRVPVEQRALRIALALQLGGAVGNLIDRLLQAGRVTDLISLGSFPVFNLADASISIGVAILLGSMLLQKRRPTEPEDALAEIEQTPG
jgi:signal peptidase II